MSEYDDSLDRPCSVDSGPVKPCYTCGKPVSTYASPPACATCKAQFAREKEAHERRSREGRS